MWARALQVPVVKFCSTRSNAICHSPKAQWFLAAALALVFSLNLSASAFAQVWGAGGAAGSGTAGGTATGSAGTDGGTAGGGGGAGGSPGGLGGHGGAGDALTHAAGGSSTGAAGADGANGTVGGGGGGGGGAGGFNGNGQNGGAGGNGGIGIVSSNPSSNLTANVSGGGGGGGGAGGNNFGPPNGGTGGNGGSGGSAYSQSSGTLTIGNASLAGGEGGAAGSGGVSNGGVGGNGGNGGAGGAGVSGANLSIVNLSGTIEGGNGGQPGFGTVGISPNPGSGSGSIGAGGVGIIGSNLTISNAGTIEGGFDGTLAGPGLGRVPAIEFTGGTNSVGNTGTISGGINVQGGSFAPALPTSAVGTALTITGPLTFASGTQYVVRVSPATSDSVSASGSVGYAMLTGATVNAQFSSGSYVSKQYTILTTTALRSGMFSGLTNTNLPAGASDSLSYDANNVYLNLTAGFTQFAGLNGNQQSVANALSNYFNSNGGIPTAFFGLNASGLVEVDGEDATGAEHSAFQLMTQFLGLMLDPWAGSGSNGGGGNAPGFASEDRDDLPPDAAMAYAAMLKRTLPVQNTDQRWSAWGSTFGGGSKADGDAVVGSNNVTASDYGFAGGMDYHVTPQTLYGFALAGGGTNWSVAQNLGSGRSDAFQAGAYSITHAGPVYLSGALAFANHWFTTNRIALGDDLIAKFQGQAYAARGEAGYRYAVMPMVGVTPYAALQLQDFHTPGYSETDLSGGGFGLSYNSMSATDTRSELGARIDDLTTFDGMPLVLRGRLAWAHDWVSNPALGAVFEALPGSNFTVNGAALPSNSALTTAVAELHLSLNWTAIAKFDGEFASSSQTYAGTGTLKYSW